MFRKIRISTKLAAALAVPLAGLVAIASFEVLEASGAAGDVRAQTQLASGALGPGSLVTGLQDERNRAAIDLIGLGSATDLAVDTNEEARALVDDAERVLREDLAGRDAAVRRTFAPALALLEEELPQLRADVDAYDGPLDISNTDFADEVFTRYTTVVEAFFDATSSIALGIDDASLRNGVMIVDAATRQTDMRARLVRDIVLLTLTGEADSLEGQQSVAALFDRARGFDQTVRVNAIGRYEGIGDATFDEERVQSFNQQVEEFMATGEVDITALLDSVRATPETGYTGLRNRSAAALSDVGRGLVADADSRERVFMIVALVAVLLACVVTWVASRSITRPLDSLREQAERMATAALPDAVQQILDTPAGEDVSIPDIPPIEVASRDEVLDVASSLNVVQRSALDLAVEQAVLRRNIADSFVNLGRRNQNLLNRQLDFITDLERDETDPDTLEGLFRLDHLATRMRRNAESLLVLAGVEPPRQWSAPAKASDVVRAALGEVEDYQRVVVRHLEPAAITGAIAADLAHVLAELIENALSFSPPEEAVEVKGRLTPQGYTVAVTDNGMGMTPAELARANRRLAGGESFTVAPSRYLGHYVAGHLAQRIGIAVELHDSPAGGITARLDIPMQLLADEELEPVVPPQPAPPRAASVETPLADAAAERLATPTPPPLVAPPSLTESGLPRRAPATAWSAEPVADGRAGDPDESQPPAAPLDQPEPVAGGLFGDAFADAKPIWAPGTGTGSEPPPLSLLREPPATEPAEPQVGSVFDASPMAESPPAELLPKRVPGAQRPDAPLGSAEPANGSEPTNGRDDPALPSTPDDVYAFLSSFQSGVTRGLADARGPEAEEDG